MKRVIATATALLVLCAGCASTAPPSARIAWVESMQASPNSPDAGTIVVVRDSGGGFGQSCGHHILLDGRLIADLMPGQGVRAAVAPGIHVVHLGYASMFCNMGEGAVSVSVSPGAASYLRVMTGYDDRSIIVPSIAPQ